MDKEQIELFKGYIPAVKDWINNLVRQYATTGKAVSSFSFHRLPLYYSKEILGSSKVVTIAKPPAVPLTSIGLTQLRDFEKMNIRGVTYLDTYFLRPDCAHLESIHFHELVHVIQWQYLGIDKFLYLYGLGLLKYGYSNSPLEKLAYALTERFEKDNKPFNVQANIIPILDEMASDLDGITSA